MNLGPFIYTSFKRLYEKSHAFLEINKCRSGKIDINSGLKQGDPISMLFYIFAIEELLCRVRGNKMIEGYRHMALKKFESKVFGYADDMNATVTTYESIRYFLRTVRIGVKYLELQ